MAEPLFPSFRIPNNPTVGNPPVGIGVPLLEKIAGKVLDYSGRRLGILPGGTDPNAELIPIVRRAIVGARRRAKRPSSRRGGSPTRSRCPCGRVIRERGVVIQFLTRR